MNILSLLDTGADASVLSCQMFAKIQREEPQSVIKYLKATRIDGLQGASGAGLRVLAMVVLRLCFGELVINQKFHLVENIRESLLLGSDFFWKYNPEINFKEKIIVIGNQKLSIRGKFQKDLCGFPVTIDCNTTIGPHSLNILPGHVNHDIKGDYVFSSE